MKRTPGRGEKGYVLLSMGISAFALCAACGLAFDVGRMYIVRNELQSLADSSALAATLRLDGTATGISRARAEVERMRTLNKWYLATRQAAENETTVEFGLSPTGAAPSSWSDNPGSGVNYSYTRVRVSVSVPIYFMSVVTAQTTSTVSAQATAGQLPMEGSPLGMFPFTPLAHTATGPDFGFIPGVQYTLRWASSPKLNFSNVCPGDQDAAWIDQANSRESQNRGYYGEQISAAEMRNQVVNDAPVEFFEVGDIIPLTGGAKTTVGSALVQRVNADPDPNATTFTEYRQQGHSRRIVTMPITNVDSQILGYGRFFLLVASHYANAQGNDPWCAEYIGPGAPEGSDSGGASPSAGMTRVRLTE
jgi:hypothetical protein